MYNKKLLIYALAILLFAFPFLLMQSGYEFSNAELLLIEQGLHPQKGFLENPFLTSVFSMFSNAMGNHFFFYKMWSCVFVSLSFLIAAEMVLLYGGGVYGIVLVFLAFLSDSYLQIHFSFQASGLNLLLIILLFFTVLKWIHQNHIKWQILFCLLALLLLFNGSENQLFLIALITGIGLSFQWRFVVNVFFIAMMALVISVVFLAQHYYPDWNIQWFNFSKIGSKVASTQQFCVVQFVLIVSVIYLWIMGLLYLLLTKKGRQQYLFLLNSQLVLALLILSSNGNSHQMLMSYLPIMAVGAYNFERLTLKRLHIIRYLLITISVYLSFIYMPFVLPIVSPEDGKELFEKRKDEKLGKLKWGNNAEQTFLEIYKSSIGKQCIVNRIAELYNRQPEANQQQIIIYTNDAGLASGINYYGREFNLPKAYCPSRPYYCWMPEKLEVNRIILVANGQYADKDTIFSSFKTVLLTNQISTPYLTDSITKIYLYENASANIGKALQNMRNREMSKVGIDMEHK